MHLGIDASRAAIARRTGTEAYAYYLIRALLPLASARGHRVTLYYNRPPAAALFPGATARVIPLPRLWTHLRLAWELRQRPPDVFFTPAHVVPLAYFGPGVATVHDLGYYHFPSAHTRFQVFYLDWSTRHNARRSRHLFADSRATRDDLARLYHVDPAKVTVVYPGIDPELAPVRDPTRLAAVQAHYEIEPPYLLYLGTLQPRKNLSRLVSAYATSGVDQTLVLAGQAGWLAESVLETITAQPPAIRARIRITGFVAEADKAALLSGATALLYPSLYEGFGFPVLEAQACATPVLCADNSSLPEVAGEAALLVEATDTAAIGAGIQRLVADEKLRAQLVTAGLANVRRFSWEAAARQALALLEKVAADNG